MPKLGRKSVRIQIDLNYKLKSIERQKKRFPLSLS